MFHSANTATCLGSANAPASKLFYKMVEYGKECCFWGIFMIKLVRINKGE